ncbi:hypothetical protein AN958_11355 [Leucoagaricus sp. SymC.cos]|nr:hypothetical protein AN958_11355 [Leucoagaricus sp. SymC.cos]
MNDRKPVVVTLLKVSEQVLVTWTSRMTLFYAKLAPPSHPIFRLKEIFILFRTKLEELALVLASTQEPEDSYIGLSLQFREILRPLRMATGEQVDQFAGLLISGLFFTPVMLEFLDAFPITFDGLDAPRIFRVLVGQVQRRAKDYEKAEREMKEVSQVTMSVVERLKDVLDQSEFPILIYFALC